MSKATKIDANTWHYRGFTISRVQWGPKGGHQLRWQVCVEQEFVHAFPRLGDARYHIDHWFLKLDDGVKIVQHIADSCERARRIACERGETTDCPEQHLCRHGIDN
jgi:hypothetical protein